MSNVYVHEPPTGGKVVVRTTSGDIEIELWTKQTPKACRNFLQLSLEGYYDGCIFHRVIKDFLVQTGDPTGRGDGGESIYGEPFAQEIHSRLRFRYRGVVAFASEGEDGNKSQFFITLDETSWLDGKNTIFGKVVGDTIFNVVRFADLEVDSSDRPLYPPKIKRIDVLLNPFDDILPREGAKRAQADADAKASKPAIGAVKNKTLLSFGDDEEEEGDDAVDGPADGAGAAGGIAVHPSVKGAAGAAGTTDGGPSVPAGNGAAAHAKGKQRFVVQDSSESEDGGDGSDGSEAENPAGEANGAAEARLEYNRLRDEMVRKKRAAKASLAGRKEDKERLEQEAEFVSPLEARRAKYLHKRRVAEAGGREQATLSKLRKFSGAIRQGEGGADEGERAKSGQEESAGADRDENGAEASSAPPANAWMSHRLVFPRDVHDKFDDAYVVEDPLAGKRGKKGDEMHRRRDDKPPDRDDKHRHRDDKHRHRDDKHRHRDDKPRHREHRRDKER